MNESISLYAIIEPRGLGAVDETVTRLYGGGAGRWKDNCLEKSTALEHT